MKVFRRLIGARALILVAVVGALAALPASALAGGEVLNARVTGGGWIYGQDSYGNKVRITHGFELHCNSAIRPDNLEVNWGGNHFHLTSLSSKSFCYLNPNINAGHPNAPANTFIGYGTGRLNGVNGAQISFIITDAGEPGTRDEFGVQITVGGDTVLYGDSHLLGGNHQFHRENKK